MINMVSNEIKEFDRLKGKKNAYSDFGIEFTYNSQRIEGSTLTLQETRQLILTGEKPPLRSEAFIKETINHYNTYLEMLQTKQQTLYGLVHEWHYKQFKDTKAWCAGAPRCVNVGIYGTDIRFPEWQTIPYHLMAFLDWYDRVKGGIHPVYLAALVHLKFVNIHPYEDGNGRTSRLLMNYVLHSNDYPMVDIKVKQKREYIEALNMAREYCDDWSFVKFIGDLFLLQNNG